MQHGTLILNIKAGIENEVIKKVKKLKLIHILLMLNIKLFLKV